MPRSLFTSHAALTIFLHPSQNAERSMQESLQKKFVSQLNKSREAIGSAGGSSVVKVTSGNQSFDSKLNGKYDEMVAQVRQQMRERGSKETSQTSLDGGSQVAVASASNVSAPHNPMQNSTKPAVPTNFAPREYLQNIPSTHSTSAPDRALSHRSFPQGSTTIANAAINVVAQTFSSPSTSNTGIIVNPYKPTVVANPYKPAVISTPISVKKSMPPASRVVTDPKSNSKVSNHSYTSPQQAPITQMPKTPETWDCKACTFKNVLLKPRTSPKCSMCNGLRNYD